MRERLTVYISDWESGESLSVKWICKLVSGFLCGGTVQRCGNKRSFKPVQSLKGGNTLVTSRKLAKYHDLPQFFFFSLSFINRKYCLLAIMSSFSRPVQSSRFFYRTNKTKQRSSYPDSRVSLWRASKLKFDRGLVSSIFSIEFRTSFPRRPTTFRKPN